MSPEREKLREAMCRYVTDTISNRDTVRKFCEKISKWTNERNTELIKMRDIKDRADKIDLNFSHVTESENKVKAFWEFTKSTLTQMTADSRHAELQRKLAAVLEGTLRGLKKLDCFLDAVEKLAVTSLHVFMEENQVLHLPNGISLEEVQLVIIAARLICPLLLQFKRDSKVFFLPKLQNTKVLSYQLVKYVQTTQKICVMFEKSRCPLTMTKETLDDLDVDLTEDEAQRLLNHTNQLVKFRLLAMTTKIEVDLHMDLSEDEIQRMLCHIDQLDEIRMNQNFRMVFLFQEVSCCGFINEINKRLPGMQKFLNQLEECAVQLDRMNKGAKISSVAGSSVGAIGGVLSIVGLALIPVTAGVSVALTMTGVGLGITSSVNSIITIATEIGVNCTQTKKANEVFQSFMEDMQSVQAHLEEVTSQLVPQIERNEKDVDLEVGKMLHKIHAVGKDIASTSTLSRSEELIASAGKVLAQEGEALGSMSREASDNPDTGQTAVKGPPALIKVVQTTSIVSKVICIGMNISSICKDGTSLCKGSETEASRFIRARAALWSSEMDSWKKFYDSLCEGLKTTEKHRAVLENPFYPRRERNSD